MKNKTKDTITRLLSIVSIIIALISLLLGYINNKQNNLFQIDQFNRSNAPEFSIDSIRLIEVYGLENDLASDKFVFSVYVTNKSNQYLKIKTSLITLYPKKDFIVRYNLLNDSNYKSSFYIPIRDNIFDNNILPNNSFRLQFNLPCKEVSDSISTIHFYLVAESEKGGYYDKYSIVDCKKIINKSYITIDTLTKDTISFRTESDIKKQLSLQYNTMKEGDSKIFKSAEMTTYGFYIFNFRQDSYIYNKNDIEKINVKLKTL